MKYLYRHFMIIKRSFAAVAVMMMLFSTGLQAQPSHVTVGGNVFGGGNMASVGGGTTVLIDQANAVISGDIYGGGALAEVDTVRKGTVLSTTDITDSILVTILQG